MTAIDRWLFALADPESLRADPPHARLDRRQVASLTVLAEIHGVLPATLAHVDELLRSNPELLLTNPEAKAEVSAAIEPMRKRVAERSAIAMFLNAESRRLRAELSAAGAQVIPLKGGDFAARLYKPASLRSFVDVDLLVRAGDWERVIATMSRLGFAEHKTELKHAVGYSERTWEHPSVPGAMIEVHDDLVNSPTVRGGVSVRLEDLPTERASDQSLRATPAGLLIIAAVHAAASHSFDKVQHLCDLAQIVRGRAGNIDEAVVRECAKKTGAGLSVAVALDLMARAFNERAAADLLSRLNMKWPRWLTRLLITPGLVASAQGERLYRGLWRRRMLRQMLKSRR
jgi:hypothetical protein